MPPSDFLLVELSGRESASGKASWMEGLSKPVSFRSAEEMARKSGADNGSVAVLFGGGSLEWEQAEVGLYWPAGGAHVWCANDAAHALGLSSPGDSDSNSFMLQLLSALEAISNDLLAQLAHLVQEWGAETRLGIFAWELARRFDVLNQPSPGEVDIAQFVGKGGNGEAAQRQEIAPDILEQVFEATERIAGAFDAYEERPQQVRMARDVGQALEESNPLIIEAGTGVGKSLAYLLPLAVYAARTGKLCIVSTNTLNLQQQLIEMDIPRLRQILDNLEINVKLLKGREHYLCLKRLEDMWLKSGAAAAERRSKFEKMGYPALLTVLNLIIGQSDDPSGDIDVTDSAPGLSLSQRSAILRSVDCGFPTCLGERCEYKSDCHFFARRAEALKSHIVITNHALVFSLHNMEDDDADNVVSRASAIVFDEAHNLESAITNQYTLEVNDRAGVDLGNRALGLVQHEMCRRRLELPVDSIGSDLEEAFSIAQEAAGKLPEWVKYAAAAGQQVSSLLEQATQKGHLQAGFDTQLTSSTATAGQVQVMGLLQQLAEKLLAVLEKYQQLVSSLGKLFANEDSDMYLEDVPWQMDLQSLNLDLAEAQNALRNWIPSDPEKICWFNSGAKDLAFWEYKTAPLDVGPMFQSLLNQKDCTIMCSATLAVSGTFDYMQRSLGFDPGTIGRSSWEVLDSPFDYGSQASLMVANDLARPTGDFRHVYLEQLEDVVAGVCDIFERGVLVLFNSYRDLMHIAERLPARIDGGRILVQGGGESREQLSTRFRTEGDKVLLATRSFWEGFDVSGEALSCVVLAKLPFANFMDPIHAGRQRAIAASGEDSFRMYSLPLAVMQLKQGFGRLIRTKSDKGCVFLLDSRAANSSYGKVFLDSLPGPRTFIGGYSDCLEEARQFMGFGNER